MGDLITAFIDGLLKIPLPVKQAHGHKWQPQVTGGLAVVTCQDAESAGING